MRALRLFPLLFVLACSDDPGGGNKGGDGGHRHESPRGGTLVEVGDHAAQLDLVLDAETGALHAYVMDGHAEQAVRVAQAKLPLVVDVGGEEVALDVEAQADPLSGETVGDTSHFRAASDRLKGRRAFKGRIMRITVRGQEYRDIPFAYGSEGAE